MKIKWLGHASFLITSDSGVRIITDPYEQQSNLKYEKIVEAADVVTVSHDHRDHNNVAAIRGNPQIVKKTAEAKGIRFRGIDTHHDATGGSQRGGNTLFCFEIDGMNVCHGGDLGHPLSDAQLAELGKVDILLIPVGGFYTIDAKVASQVCDQLKPQVIIPMHYKNEKCQYPITGVDVFLKGKDNVKKLDSSEVEPKKENMPASTQIIVLKPAK